MVRPLSLSLLPAALAFAVASAGCGGEAPFDPDAVAAGGRAIVNGTPTSSEPAVGALVRYPGAMCTATLVGKRTVITASHCVQPGVTHYFYGGGRRYRARSVTRHSGYKPPSTNNDVAIVILEDAPPIKPASISTKPPKVGQRLALYGYGATSSNRSGSGRKRVGTNRVAFLTSTRIVINGSSGQDANLCFGDSGGPSFALIDGREVVVGIHSTISGACGRQGHDMRVDVYADWAAKTAGGDIFRDGKGPDVTPPKVEITAPRAGAEVVRRFTVEARVTDDGKVAKVELVVDGRTAATATRAPYRFTVQQAPGNHKLTVRATDEAGNRGQAEVTVRVAEPRPFGSDCTEPLACAGDLCAAFPGLAESYCTQVCTPGGDPCPAGAECLPAGGGKSVCGPPRSKLEAAGLLASGGCALAAAGGPAGRPAPLLAFLAGLAGLILLARRRRR